MKYGMTDKEWSMLSKKIIARDKVCQWDTCDKTTRLHTHHAFPYKLYGINSPRILFAVCERHHYECDWLFDRTGKVPNSLLTKRGIRRDDFKTPTRKRSKI